MRDVIRTACLGRWLLSAVCLNVETPRQLLKALGDVRRVLWLHANHRQHEYSPGDVKYQQLAASVPAECYESRGVGFDFEIGVVVRNFVDRSQHNVAG